MYPLLCKSGVQGGINHTDLLPWWVSTTSRHDPPFSTHVIKLVLLCVGPYVNIQERVMYEHSAYYLWKLWYTECIHGLPSYLDTKWMKKSKYDVLLYLNRWIYEKFSNFNMHTQVTKLRLLLFEDVFLICWCYAVFMIKCVLSKGNFFMGCDIWEIVEMYI